MSWYNPASWHGVHDYLFGGGATEGIDAKPEHGQYMADYIQNQLGGVGDRQAPGFQSADATQSRGQMQSLADRLNSVARGTEAGAGELAVNRQVGQAQAQQTAQANMARGGNTAMAARNAARNTADIGVAGAGQAAMAQMNDQNAANQQLSGLLSNMRGQDIGIGQGNQQSQLSQEQLNQQAQLGYLAQLLGVDQATLQAQLGKAQIAAGDKGIFPYLLQAGGQIAAHKV